MKNSLIHCAPAAPPPGGHDTKRLLLKQAINRNWPVTLAILLLLAFALSTMFATAAPMPSAQDILASVRFQQSQQQIDLEGQLRQDPLHGSDRPIIVPFHLTQTGPVVRYSFSDPDESLQLKLGETDSRLEEISRDGVDKISGPEFDQKVRGTAITYADLALKFLYWPNGRVLGEDSIKTRKCWKLQLPAPSRNAQYASVLLWVDKQGGALMRLEGYDWNGKLAKRFEVVSAQKIEGRWFLKNMRIEEMQPETGNVSARTYLEIKK